MRKRNCQHDGSWNGLWVIPVDCSYCGKTFATADPNRMEHAVLPEKPICTDCLFKRNMDRIR